MQRRSSALAALAGSLIAAGSAQATWSIVLIDIRTGEVALGSATCLTGFDLQANTPVLLTGIGGATAQSAVDGTSQNRVFIRDRMWQGMSPTDILAGLAVFDSGHQSRQYGFGDTLGRVATFTGTGAGQWAGGQTGEYDYSYLGQVGHIVYAIQGNVLTGAPVVQMAVQAAINSPGDLPAKLMSAMEAARLMGGDGRCSCSPGNPTGCGSPPPTFTKSAHIAYMLIARAGDTDGSIGAYRCGSAPWALVTRDYNLDGKPDVACVNSSTSNISMLLNNTPSGCPFGTFPLPVNTQVGVLPRSMATGDITGDGILDIVTANLSAQTISVVPGLGGGALGPRSDYSVDGQPTSIALGDFDGVNGLDVVECNNLASSVSVLLNTGGGVLGPPSSTFILDPKVVVAQDITGDGKIDIITASRAFNKLVVLKGNGNGTFTPAPDIFTDNLPSAVAPGDLDHDGDVDLVVANQGTPLSASILLNDGAGNFTKTSLIVPSSPTAIALGDVNNDGNTDALVAQSGGRFTILFGSANGAFTLGGTYTTGGFLNDAVLADFNGDGTLDAAFANAASSILVVQNMGAGVFHTGLGTASGDYFMTFNVANQQVPDPDPVIQLQGIYATWRQNLKERPDAVQTTVDFNPPTIAPSMTGSSQSTMTIHLRDWEGSPAIHAISSVQVTNLPGSPALTVGAPIAQGGGVYTVQLTGGAVAGVAALRVKIDDGVRPVTLMPDPHITVEGCYADCDHNGSLNITDFICFQTKFALGDPYADCDGNGVKNINDFICFQTKFALGCP